MFEDLTVGDLYQTRFTNLLNAIERYELLKVPTTYRQAYPFIRMKETAIMNIIDEDQNSQNVNKTPPPLIVAFRKNISEILNDRAKKYVSNLEETNVCRFTFTDKLSDLPQALSKQPQCLLFYASGLFDQHTSISEFVMMLKSMIHFTNPNANIKIGFVIDQETPYTFIKELQKANINGVVPTLGAWGEAETTKGFEALINGIAYWPKHLIEQLPGNATKPRRTTIHLTHRQQEVLDLIANRGLTNKQIARVLGISESTVKIHVSVIMKAYCVRNRTQLALTKK